MGAFKDITGQRFGRLTVLKPTPERRYASVVWLCQCDCGQQVSVDGKNLRRGDTRSCGCGLSDRHDTIAPVLQRARELAESGRFERWQDIAHRLKYLERLARVRPTLSRASLRQELDVLCQQAKSRRRALLAQYTLLVAQDGRGLFTWEWEVYRNGAPLPARLRQNGFSSEYIAKAAGEKARREFLSALAQELD